MTGSGTSNNSNLDARDAIPTNVTVTANRTTGNVVVNYDLSPSAGAMVRLNYSTDGGTTWLIMRSVSGAAGTIVPAGTGRSGQWDFLADLGSQSTATSLMVRVTSFNGGALSAFSTSIPFNVRSASKPQQKVNFCFGYPWPRTVAQHNAFWCNNLGIACNANPDVKVGETAAAAVPTDEQDTLMALARQVYERAGVVDGLVYSRGAPLDGAINLYFINPQVGFPNWAGKGETPGLKGSPDQFNKVPDGTIGVVYFGDMRCDVPCVLDTVVHEIGHCLGLFHVDPNTVGDAQNPVLPGLLWNQCVMDYFQPAPGTSITVQQNFWNAPAVLANPGARYSPSVNPGSAYWDVSLAGFRLLRTNETYHLLRWTELLPSSQITSVPGDYDLESGAINGASPSATSNFILNTPQPLYNVQIWITNGAEGNELVAQYPVLTPTQLASLQVPVAGIGDLQILASSTPGGDADTVLVAPQAVGVPFADLKLAGESSLQIMRITEGAATVVGSGISTQAFHPVVPAKVDASVVGESTSPTVNLRFASIPGQLYAIERSTSLAGWIEVTRFTAADTLVSWTDPTPPAGLAHVFYRVNVSPRP